MSCKATRILLRHYKSKVIIIIRTEGRGKLREMTEITPDRSSLHKCCAARQMRMSKAAQQCQRQRQLLQRKAAAQGPKPCSYQRGFQQGDLLGGSPIGCFIFMVLFHGTAELHRGDVEIFNDINAGRFKLQPYKAQEISS